MITNIPKISEKKKNELINKWKKSTGSEPAKHGTALLTSRETELGLKADRGNRII